MVGDYPYKLELADIIDIDILIDKSMDVKESCYMKLSAKKFKIENGYEAVFHTFFRFITV